MRLTLWCLNAVFGEEIGPHGPCLTRLSRHKEVGCKGCCWRGRGLARLLY